MKRTRTLDTGRGKFRISPAGRSGRFEKFEVVVTIQGQDHPLGMFYEDADGARQHAGVSTFPNADELLRHVMQSLP